MSATDKLVRLKYWWLAYAVLVVGAETVRGYTTLFEAAIFLALIYGLASYLTKQLVEKSSLVWAFGVVFGLIGTLTAGIALVETIVDASDGRGFDLGKFLLAAASAYIHVRTFRVLRDADVKRHVMLD